MAAPTCPGGSSVQYGSGTSATLPSPSGAAFGEMLIIVIANYSGTSGSFAVTDPGNRWEQVYNGVAGLAIFKRPAGAAEPANYTVSWTTACTGVAVCFRVAGATSGAFDLTPTFNTNGSSTSDTCPTVTPLWATDLLVSVYAHYSNATQTLPGSQTSVVQANGATSVMGITVAKETLSSTSATGTRVATASGSGSSYGISFTFRESQPTVVNTLLLPEIAHTGTNVIAGVGPKTVLFNAAAESAPSTELFGVVKYNWCAVGVGAWAPTFGVNAGYAGPYKVAGTVTDGGVPPLNPRLVTLAPHGAPSVVIRSVYTDSGVGTFAFTGLAPGKYVLSASNPDNSEESIIHSYVSAVPA